MTEASSMDEVVCLPRHSFKSLSGPRESTSVHLQTTAYEIMQDTHADTVWADGTPIRPIQTLVLKCSEHSGFQVHLSLPFPASAISHIQYWCDAGRQEGRLSGGHACKVPGIPYDQSAIRVPARRKEMQSKFGPSVADVYEDNLLEGDTYHSLCLEPVFRDTPQDNRYTYLGRGYRLNGTECVPTMYGYRLGMMTHRRGFGRPLTGWETLTSYDQSYRNSVGASAARPITTYGLPESFIQHVATVSVIDPPIPDPRGPYSSHVDRRPSSPTVPASGMPALTRSVVPTVQPMRPGPLAISTARRRSHQADESWYSPSSSDGGRHSSRGSIPSTQQGDSRRPSMLSFTETPTDMLRPLPFRVQSGQGGSGHPWATVRWETEQDGDEAEPS